MPAQVNGGITISNKQMKYDKEIEAEIAFRKTDLNKPCNHMKAKEKKTLLRLDTVKNRVAKGKTLDGIKLKDTKYPFIVLNWLRIGN